MTHLAANPALWIALAAAVLVILAHGGLFWWFLCRGKNRRKDQDKEDP
ncbi:MAG: hypothetical protein MUF13_00480 [Akkermansiaceae bacterium]|nr:hypothetical protein [Akkermansiaceae bacterium]